MTSFTGSITCDKYCRGSGGNAPAGEMPKAWNGAECYGSASSGTCYALGQSSCTCQTNGGKGWAGYVNQTLTNTNGTRSCEVTCQGASSSLPSTWNGATCVSSSGGYCGKAYRTLASTTCVCRAAYWGWA